MYFTNSTENVWKKKTYTISDKETRKQNSDQFEFSRMIIENTEAFRIKFMNDSKS